MRCTTAQLIANRNNAKKSTGPKTQEGKENSRRNGWKHGLTGAGVVLPHEDEVEVTRRFETLEAEMQPRHELARLHLRRVAFMSLRLDRCVAHECKAIAYQMRQATREFDHERLVEAEHAYDWLAADPKTNARILRSSPEGIDLVVKAMNALKDELERRDGQWWTTQHSEFLHHLMGQRHWDVPYTRARCLYEAIVGKFEYLSKNDAPELSHGNRQSWAIERMIELIEAEIAGLMALRASFDVEGRELDRAEAPARAMFNASKEAVLARKYEASSERSLFKNEKEFFELNALSPQAAAEQPVEPEPAEESGSCLPEVPDEEVEAEEPAPGFARPADLGPIRGEIDALPAGKGSERGRRVGRAGRSRSA